MDKHDQKNLEFLLNATPEVLHDWFDTMIALGQEDDIAYAMELVQAARNQLELELLEIFDLEAEEDVALASAYLKRFRLQ